METWFIPIVMALGAISAVARFYLLSKRSLCDAGVEDEPQEHRTMETFTTQRDERTWRRAYSKLS